jgi:hypothetical protein
LRAEVLNYFLEIKDFKRQVRAVAPLFGTFGRSTSYLFSGTRPSASYSQRTVQAPGAVKSLGPFEIGPAG